MGAPCCPFCFSRRIGPAFTEVHSNRRVAKYDAAHKKIGKQPSAFNVALPGNLRCLKCGEEFSSERAKDIGNGIGRCPKVKGVVISPSQFLNKDATHIRMGFSNRKNEYKGPDPL